ncbi:MAG: hypothetical protein IPL08_12795, partial [Saprospiraceae bacterium]|nr:hypothetical protein [Saprospiraceae bacterium]
MENSKEIFQSQVIGTPNPLDTLDICRKRLFDFDKPMYWHLNNILLHLICVFRFSHSSIIGHRLARGTVYGATLGVHPMRSESVAWVTERKDVLFGV